MKFIYTTSAKLLLILLIWLPSWTGLLAQPTGINYSFTQPALASFPWNDATAGYTTLINGGVDEQLVSFPAPAGWGGFYYGGVWYPQATTTFYVSSNGWMSVGKTGDPVPAGPIPINDLTNNPYRIMAPLWDDLKVHAQGMVSYRLSPGATTRQLTIEWQGMYWDKSGVDSAISFQVRIFDNLQATVANRNKIEFHYKRNSTSTYAVVNATASIGLNGFCSKDVLAFTSVAGAPSKTTPENQALNSKPSDTQNHTFTPIVHPNDDCASAYSFATFSAGVSLISSVGTTLHSTQSAIPVPACGGVTTTSDVWYTFTKPASITNFEIFTDSLDCRGAGNYSVGIEVFTSCGGASVACNLGSSGPAGTNASSYLNLTNQPCGLQAYWVRVFSTDTSYRGYFRFNIRPPGRDCSYATDISGCCTSLPFNYSSPTSLSTCGFNNDVDSLAPCSSLVQRGQDYVFRFTPCSTMCATFNLNNTTAGSNPGMFIYYNPPCAGGSSCVGSVTSVGGGTLTFPNATLAAGNTYYIVIDYDSGGFTPCLTGWDLSISGVTPPVISYDACAGAQSFTPTVGASCVGAVNYNNSCATPTPAGTYPAPPLGCGNFTDGVTPDVWFTFNSLSAQPHQINVDLGTAPAAQDLAMAIYTGNCGGLSLVSCDDNSNGTMPSLTITPAGAGVTYYVRIWSNNGTTPGNFRICAIQGCTPLNDLCTGAISLTVGVPLQGDNGCSTGTGEPSSGTAASCWTTGSLNTVWYSFVATNSQMRIRTRLLTLFDSQIALYSLPTGCGGAFTQLFCNDNAPATCGSGTIRFSEMTATGLTVGTTYYVRVDGTQANTGTFEICVMDGTNPFPPIPQQDCVLPINVCSNASFTVANPGFQGTGNVCDFTGGSCLATGERGSAFYLFSITGPQTLQFTITPNSPNDYDFMIWCIDTVWNNNPNHSFPTVTNYCSNLMGGAGVFPWYSCNYSAIGTTGLSLTCMGVAAVIPSSQPATQCGGFNQAVNIPAGMTATFLLNVSNFTTSTTGFTMNWNGTVLNSNPPSMTWQNSSNSTWGTLANWYPTNCGAVPDCPNQVGAIIAAGAWPMPVLSANQTVKDLTINAGASLTINAGITLSVCGNFTNNGNLNCIAGSTVQFIGGLNQTISGTFLPALNNFYNFTVSKSAGTLTFNTNIYARGNFSINGPTGTVNVNNKNIEIGGNFYNYNGSTSFTGHGAGGAGSTLTFTRRSGVNQTFQNDGTNLTLNNVMINQLVMGTVSLNANATSDLITGVSGIFTLQMGVVVTGAGTAREVNVTNSASVACSPGNPSSWVFGKLRRAIATAANFYDFPVGTLTNYELAQINYTSAPSGTYNLLAEFKTWGGGNCPFPGMGPATSECVTATYQFLPYFDHGYWSINASIGAPTGIYDATMYNVGMTNNLGSGWTVVKAAPSTCAFALAGTCWIPSTAVQTRRQALSGFSDFATVQSTTPLPIELLFFEATQVNNQVSCKWVTAVEINNDHFDVERSTDAVNWHTIGHVKGYGPGVSGSDLYYQLMDDKICSGKVYYRLKQIDVNGAFTYSDIVSVSCKNSLLNLSPNPTTNNVILNFYEQEDGTVSVDVTDMVGQLVHRQQFSVYSGYNDIEVDVNTLPEGVYYLKIINNNMQPDEVARQVKFLKY